MTYFGERKMNRVESSQPLLVNIVSNHSAGERTVLVRGLILSESKLSDHQIECSLQIKLEIPNWTRLRL